MTASGNEPLFDVVRPNLQRRVIPGFFDRSEGWVAPREFEEVDPGFPWCGEHSGFKAAATTKEGVVSMLIRMQESRGSS